MMRQYTSDSALQITKCAQFRRLICRLGVTKEVAHEKETADDEKHINSKISSVKMCFSI